MPKNLNYFIVPFIILVGLLIYSNSLLNEFVWDDLSFIVRNEAIRDLHNIKYFFTDAYALAENKSLARDTYRPLLILFFSVDYFLWKLHPFFYHLENILFHIIDGVLLYFLLKIIFENKIAALFGALIFLTHPIQTEVVNWVSRRGDVVAVFFFLLSILMHLRIRLYRDKKPHLYVGILTFFVVAILFKETTIILPLILLCYDIFLLGYKISYKKQLIYYLPFFIIIGVYGLTRLTVVGQISQRQWWGSGPTSTLSTMSVVFVKYINLLIIPKNLCVDHVLPVYSFSHPKVIAAIFILTAIFISAILLKRLARLFTFGVLWFFIALIPVSNIFPIKILLAERFMYLPSIGFIIAVIGIVLAQKKIFIQSFYIIACLLIMAYSIMTIERNKEWKDELTFFKVNSARSPNSSRLHYGLGTAYKKKKAFDLAKKEFGKALELNPKYTEVYNDLGNTYLEENSLDDAIKYYEKASNLSPDFFEPYYNLGNAYYQKGDYDKAILNYKKALVLEKNKPDIHYNLAMVYGKTNQTDKAVKELEATLKLNPKDSQALELLKELKK